MKYNILVDNHALLKNLTTIYKILDESFKDFNLQFSQTKTKVLAALRPGKEIYFFFYIKDLDPEMSYILKDNGVMKLANAMETTQRIERNLFELGK